MVIKKYLILFIISILSITMILAISNPGHSADEILVIINGYTMTLQEAYNGNLLKDTVALPNSGGTTSLTKYHSGANLHIYLGEELSLQEAINKIGATTTVSNKGFCRDAPGTFSWIFNLGHSADEIEFEDGETLQEKINTQQFCSYSWKELDDWGTCSVNCGGGTQSQTVYCKRSDEKDMGYTTNLCSGPAPSKTRDCNPQACATCSDGIQNQGETGVDCGGPCSACATCSDGIQNQGETGVDCGGPCSVCLKNNIHKGIDCQNAGGTVVDGSGGKICKFSQASCPSGWTANGETTTSATYCPGETGCTTGSHTFSDLDSIWGDAEWCIYWTQPCAYRPFKWCTPQTCLATITEVGCY